jgi:hypothetical protein
LLLLLECGQGGGELMLALLLLVVLLLHQRFGPKGRRPLEYLLF